MATGQSQYATIAQLQTLSLTAADATRFGSDSMTAALQRASSIADTYLASQFDLPLVTTPTQGWDMALSGAVCDIAAFLLYSQWGGGNINAAQGGDSRKKIAYDMAIAWLTSIANQEIYPLYTDSSGDPTGTDEAGPFVISDIPVGFTPRGVLDPDPTGDLF